MQIGLKYSYVANFPFFSSVRPDQYYTDVIARPMSGIGRKPVAGRDVEVKLKIFDVKRKS